MEALTVDGSAGSRGALMFCSWIVDFWRFRRAKQA
jgi:hypothetical protein